MTDEKVKSEIESKKKDHFLEKENQRHLNFMYKAEPAKIGCEGNVMKAIKTMSDKKNLLVQEEKRTPFLSRNTNSDNKLETKIEDSDKKKLTLQKMNIRNSVEDVVNRLRGTTTLDNNNASLKVSHENFNSADILELKRIQNSERKQQSEKKLMALEKEERHQTASSSKKNLTGAGDLKESRLSTESSRNKGNLPLIRETEVDLQAPTYDEEWDGDQWYDYDYDYDNY